MANKNTRNSDFLKGLKAKTSLKVYPILLKLVNEDREDLAEVVAKVDYLLQYASISIKQTDYKEAKEGLTKARTRMDMLKKEGVDIEYLEYLYEGIAKKAKL